MLRGSVLLLVLVCAACSDATSVSRDAGAFVLPDSGYIYDSGGPRQVGRDAASADASPHVCNPACDTGEVCGCVGSGEFLCGCHAPRGYAATCDPLAPDTCKWPFNCVRGRRASGTVYICSDGREGTPCSPLQLSCNTSVGCACFSTPFGTSCNCRGVQGPSAYLCDPRVPQTCPEGTCVRVEASSSTFHICSDGAEHEPCELGDMSCRTTLGCTCPFAGGRRICRCSEPGTYAGYACDPSVANSCAMGFRCEIRGDPIESGYTSECVPEGGMGPQDPFTCDPQMPLCPQGYACREVEPNVYRCRP